MPIEIGPTYINPFDPGSPGGYSLDSGWANDYIDVPAEQAEVEMIGAAGRNMILNGDGVFTAISTNNSLTVMAEAFKGLSNQPKELVLQQLKIHADTAQFQLGWYPNIHAEPYYIGDGRGDFLEPVYGNVLIGALPINYSTPFQTHTLDFYGAPNMPLGAIAYWLWGGGQPRNVRIESLNLKMDVQDFPPITALLNDPSKVGRFVIADQPFSYNTFSKGAVNLPAAGMLGRVSGTVEGTLDIQPNGTYFFSGSFKLNSDFYDADASNRTWGQEALTTFLKALGDTFGHTDYYINILGAQTLQYSGTR
ncbi:lipid II-degrading bacteriocin [Pseudomonas sp. NPDC088444]|uniref:lipid II-degrading bacteriocin n=1 Tax=Pseudomonas sp. NPDC088444 TaxID=3364456 RepID=UPI00384E7FBA